MKNLLQNTLIRRLTVLAVGIIGMASTAYALSDTYYYSVSANSSPTGAGTVYMAEQAQTVGSDGYASGVEYQTSYSGQSYSYVNWAYWIRYIFGGATEDSSTKTIYLYAKPQPGYVFTGWSTTSANATINTPAAPNTSVRIKSSSKNSGSPARFTFVANYAQDIGMVKVVSANPAWGTVSISNVENVVGEEVTITATPIASLLGVKFLYWTKTEEGGTEETIDGSTAEMTVTATDVVTTYTAYFSEPGEEKGSFVRIKNKSTGRYLSLIGDAAATQKEATHGTDKEYYYQIDGLTTVSAEQAIGDPSTVFFLSGVSDHMQGLLDCNLEAQNVSMKETITKNLGQVNAIYTSDGYHIAIKYTYNGNTTDEYLRVDNGTVFFRSGDVASSFWEVETLDEEHIDTYYFGVAPKDYFCQTDEVSGETHYYTTMYTSFSYKLMDDVKAYYIESTESIQDIHVYMTEIPNGTVVPGQRAVILETSVAGDASKCRLLPVTDAIDGMPRLMMGSFNLNGSKIMPSDFADQGDFYVLSVNSNKEKMAFYRYTKEIPANKAFVVVPKEEESTAKNAVLVWGESGRETAVESIPVTLVRSNGQRYDLSGRKATSKDKGISIVNGKKYIAK